MLSVFRNLSLRQRAAFAAAITLLFFFSLSALGLLRAYDDTLNNAAEGELRAYMLSLLGAIDVDDEGKFSLEDLSVSAFSQPNSGVYAEVWQEKQLLWRSDSLVSQVLPRVDTSLGQYRFISNITGSSEFSGNSASEDLANNILSLKIAWDDGSISEQFLLIVANDAAPFQGRQQEYRKRLFLWLLGLGSVLVFLQVLLFKWLLQPLRRVVGELSQIKAGQQQEFSEQHPAEVKVLTQSLNRFFETEGRHIKQVKQSLANLAHSLKTPLAVLQAEISNQKNDRNALQEQLDRISTIVNYQLNRTSSSVKPSYRPTVECYELVDKLIRVLQRLHESKGIIFNSNVAEGLVFKGDNDDLAEVLGNVLENACKWANSTISVTAFNDENQMLIIQVLDDGPGIPEGKRATVLQRGKRLDEKTEGQGIGLAMVSDIVDSYQGEITLKPATLIDSSYKSGLAVHIQL